MFHKTQHDGIALDDNRTQNRDSGIPREWVPRLRDLANAMLL